MNKAHLRWWEWASPLHWEALWPWRSLIGRKSPRAITLTKPRAECRGWGDSGLVQGLRVFNSLYNGLWLSSQCICWILRFYGSIFIVSAERPGEQGPNQSPGRPDVFLLYFLSVEIQVPATRLVNQLRRFGAWRNSCLSYHALHVSLI